MDVSPISSVEFSPPLGVIEPGAATTDDPYRPFTPTLYSSSELSEASTQRLFSPVEPREPREPVYIWPAGSVGAFRIGCVSVRGMHLLFGVLYILQLVLMLSCARLPRLSHEHAFPVFSIFTTFDSTTHVPNVTYLGELNCMALLGTFLVIECLSHLVVCVTKRGYRLYVTSVDEGRIVHRFMGDAALSTPFLTCILILMAGSCVLEVMILSAILMVACAVSKTTMINLNHAVLAFPGHGFTEARPVRWYPLIFHFLFGLVPMGVSIYAISHAGVQGRARQKAMAVGARIVAHFVGAGLLMRTFVRRRRVSSTVVWENIVQFTFNSFIVWTVWSMYYA